MPQDSSISQGQAAVGAPVKVGFLEMTRCTAKWGDLDHTTVDLTAEGYIREPFTAVRLTLRGWFNMLADGDHVPRPSLVVYVERVQSTFPGNVPRGFFTLDNFVAPTGLSNPGNLNPEVVFCGLEPAA